MSIAEIQRRQAEGSEPTARRNSTLPGALLLMIGVALLLAGSGKLYLDTRYEHEGRDVIGIITASDSPMSRARSIRYEFETADGHRFQGHQSRYGGRPGETIRLQYLASDPTWNRVAGSDHDDRQVFLTMGIIGALAVLGGFYSMIFVLRQRS